MIIEVSACYGYTDVNTAGVGMQYLLLPVSLACRYLVGKMGRPVLPLVNSPLYTAAPTKNFQG